MNTSAGTDVDHREVLEEVVPGHCVRVEDGLVLSFSLFGKLLLATGEPMWEWAKAFYGESFIPQALTEHLQDEDAPNYDGPYECALAQPLLDALRQGDELQVRRLVAKIRRRPDPTEAWLS